MSAANRLRRATRLRRAVTVSADGAMGYASIRVVPDREVSRMDKKESLALLAQGQDAWNAWAAKMSPEYHPRAATGFGSKISSPNQVG